MLWKIATHALPTLDKIARVVPGISSLCYLCGEAPKTAHHLFLTCPVTKLLWWQSPWQIRIEAFKDLDLNQWLLHIIGKNRYFPTTELERQRMAVFMVVAYEQIWFLRNQIWKRGKVPDWLMFSKDVLRVFSKYWRFAAMQSRTFRTNFPQTWNPIWPPLHRGSLNLILMRLLRMTRLPLVCCCIIQMVA